MTYSKHEDFSTKYFKKRWDKYIKIVLDIVKEIVENNNLSTTLEIGCAGVPLIKESDTIDIQNNHIGNPKIRETYPTYLHDISLVPWPIQNKKYDLVIGTQIWEHLNDKQTAFNELTKITKYAILTFPYKWPKGDINHKNITKELINTWTLSYPFIKELIINEHFLLRIYKFNYEN